MDRASGRSFYRNVAWAALAAAAGCGRSVPPQEEGSPEMASITIAVQGMMKSASGAT